MAEATKPLTPEQIKAAEDKKKAEAAQKKIDDDATVEASPSQAEVDLANKKADVADKEAKAVEADSNATQNEKDKARNSADDKAKDAKKVGTAKGVADKIKAERASAAATEEDKDKALSGVCSVDKATAKQSTAKTKMLEHAEYKKCCDEAKAASNAVECKKKAINKKTPKVTPQADIDEAASKAELSASLAKDSKATPAVKAKAKADSDALAKLQATKKKEDKEAAELKKEEDIANCPTGDSDEKSQEKLDIAKKDTQSAKDNKSKSSANLDKAEDDINDAKAELADLAEELKDRLAEKAETKAKITALKKIKENLSADKKNDTKRSSIQTEIEGLEAKIKAIEKKVKEINTKKQLASYKKTDAEAVKKAEDDKAEAGTDDVSIKDAEGKEKTAQKAQDEADERLRKLEEEAEAAKEKCEELKDVLSEDYPETFGKAAQNLDAATEEREDCIEAIEDENSEPFSLPDLDIPALAALATLTVPSLLSNLGGHTNNFTNSSGGANASPPPGEEGVYLHWNAPALKGAEGVLENLITDHLQPIYKHSFIGEFPDKIQGLDWLVKTMDRPKIDIEYVEQIRNNVKRQYPIKYNFGDLSMTFHDDAKHKTILTLHNYFTNDVWDHDDIGSYGNFKMRDSVLIPEIKIYDLTVETGQHLRYTYRNISLVSLDYDAPDEAEDAGTHTIQAVFKIEGYVVEESKSPPTLNTGNSPAWV